MNRRRFLGLLKAAGALVAAGAVLPSFLFWWRGSRVESASSGVWIDLGAAKKIPEGEWLSRTFSYERLNRWRREVSEELVYVRRVGRDLTVISPICPHARCLVRPQEEGFFCACHRSTFDGEGVPLDGPSPRALDPLEWRVVKGRLKVNYQQFRAGVAESEVV